MTFNNKNARYGFEAKVTMPNGEVVTNHEEFRKEENMTRRQDEMVKNLMMLKELKEIKEWEIEIGVQ